MQTHNIMGIRSKVIMNRYINDVIVMEEISEEDENNIDRIMTNDNGYFSNKENYMISTRDIFLYGEINLNKKSDINLIENTDLIIEDVNNACNIPSNFDYDKGIIYSDNTRVNINSGDMVLIKHNTNYHIRGKLEVLKIWW